MKQELKQLILKILDDIRRRVENDVYDMSEETGLLFLEFAERLSRNCEPLTKTEVAEKLHCCTKTVDRYVEDGYLTPGYKRIGHSSLYWRHSDVDECKRRLKKRDDSKKAGA